MYHRALLSVATHVRTHAITPCRYLNERKKRLKARKGGDSDASTNVVEFKDFKGIVVTVVLCCEPAYSNQDVDTTVPVTNVFWLLGE